MEFHVGFIIYLFQGFLNDYPKILFGFRPRVHRRQTKSNNTNDTDCTKISQGAEQHKKEQSYQRDRKIATTTTEERTYPEHHQLNEQLSGYTTTKPTTTATTITIAKKRILKGGTSGRLGAPYDNCQKLNNNDNIKSKKTRQTPNTKEARHE